MPVSGPRMGRGAYGWYQQYSNTISVTNKPKPKPRPTTTNRKGKKK